MYDTDLVNEENVIQFYIVYHYLSQRDKNCSPFVLGLGAA